MNTVALASLRLNGGTQSRAEINEQMVAEYAEAMEAGEQFPPVIAFHDGANYWLADGFHRVHAARKLGLLDIAADVRTGTRRDAVLFSVGVNAAHGMRRTPGDKRKAVMTCLAVEQEMLADGSLKEKWSDRDVARRCAVDGKTVATVRSSLTAEFRSETPTTRTYTDKHGKTTTMKTGRIGRKKRTKRETPASAIVNETSDAILFAEMALSQLSRIRRDDPKRREALLEVQVWIGAQLAEERNEYPHGSDEELQLV